MKCNDLHAEFLITTTLATYISDLEIASSLVIANRQQKPANPSARSHFNKFSCSLCNHSMVIFLCVRCMHWLKHMVFKIEHRLCSGKSIFLVPLLMLFPGASCDNFCSFEIIFETIRTSEKVMFGCVLDSIFLFMPHDTRRLITLSPSVERSD